MRTFRCLVAALGAAALLAAAVGGAAARNLSTSNQNLRVTFRSVELGEGEETTIIRCPATLEGSFHTRTIAKVARALVGSVTKATVKQEACTGGIAASFNGVERYNGATTPNTLPWHLTYEGFTGTLPNITSLQILYSRFRFGIRDTSAFCTAQWGSAEDNLTISATREAGGGITGVAPVIGRDRVTLIRRDAGFTCPITGRIGGTGEVFVLSTTTRVSISLI